MTSPAATSGAPRRRRLGGFAAFILKLAVTLTCLWYAFQSVSLADVILLVGTTSLFWFGLGVLVIVIQIPLVGLRWCRIVQALAAPGEVIPRLRLMAITAIGLFLGQVTPNIVGDSLRVWLLKRLGRSWREAVISIVIDRSVGFGVLLVIAFCALLFPSDLTALGGNRGVAFAVIGALLVAGACGILFAPFFASLFARRQLTRWLGDFARAISHIFLRNSSSYHILAIAFVVHALTIISIWSLGRAQGFDLSALDAAVLFSVMAAIALIPITIGGWGLRELAVPALLQLHGVPLERALLFSVSFGLAFLLASTVGALVWAVYSPDRVRSTQ